MDDILNMDDVKLEFIPVENSINVPKRGIRLTHAKLNIVVEYDKSTKSIENFAKAKIMLAHKVKEAVK